MASQSSNETHEQKTSDENEQGSNNEDHIQRKRSRVGSHPDERSENQVTDDTENETDKERSTTPVENQVTSDAKIVIGPVKRRKLNVDVEEVVDQDEKTNDSVQSIITTASNESKDESSTTTTTTTDDDEDEEEEEEEEEEDTKDEDIDEQMNLPPTTNIYLRLRQRELGIFHRPRERTTSRAFHNNIIASRTLIQRMKVSHTLDGHNGCVNALAFNRTGNPPRFAPQDSITKSFSRNTSG